MTVLAACIIVGALVGLYLAWRHEVPVPQVPMYRVQATWKYNGMSREVEFEAPAHDILPRLRLYLPEGQALEFLGLVESHFDEAFEDCLVPTGFYAEVSGGKVHVVRWP